MKNLVLFLLIMLLFFSCSPDNDKPLDPFIGNWESVSVSLLLNDGTVKEVAITECEQLIYMYAGQEGGFILEISAYNEEYGDCYIHISSYKSDWNKVSANQYFVEMKFYYTHPYLLDSGEYYEEGETGFMLDLSFPDERTMYVHNQELFGFYPESVLDEDVVSFSIIYKKLGAENRINF